MHSCFGSGADPILCYSVGAGLSLVLVSGHAVSYSTEEEFRPNELHAAEVV